MRNLILIVAPSDKGEEESRASKVSAVINGTPWLLTGHDGLSSTFAERVLHNRPSFDLPIRPDNIVAEVEAFATRFAGGNGSLVIQKESIRKYLLNRSMDSELRASLIKSLDEDAACIVLNIDEHGRVQNIHAADDHRRYSIVAECVPMTVNQELLPRSLCLWPKD